MNSLDNMIRLLEVSNFFYQNERNGFIGINFTYCGHCRFYDRLSKWQPPPYCVPDSVYFNCLCLANVHKNQPQQ